METLRGKRADFDRRVSIYPGTPAARAAREIEGSVTR